MKWVYIFSLLLILIGFQAFAQEEDHAKYQDTIFIRHNKDWTKDTLLYVTDTVIFRSGMQRHILVGTTVLPGTTEQQSGWTYGLHLDKAIKSDCRKDVTEYGGSIPDKINSISMTDSSLVVDINISANCCYDFLCDMEIDSAGLLNLKYQGYGSFCACDCCFGLTYFFNLDKEKDTPDIKGVMINGNRKTIKKIKKH